MTKHTLIKAALVAVALVMGSSAIKSSNLFASGYIIASSITGETECQQGGSSDCPGAT